MSPPGPGQAKGPAVASSAQATPAVDLQRLADKVYRLFLEDLRASQLRTDGKGRP